MICGIHQTKMKYILSFLFCIAYLNFYAQDAQNQPYIFTGTTIDEALDFETTLNSKLKKSNATIVLSPELYPNVNDYQLANPKQIARAQPTMFPAEVEYYYDTESREVKFTSYRWAFINKIDDNTLFNKRKLRTLVEKECGELEAYTEFFLMLEKIIDKKYKDSKKSVLKKEPRNQTIWWENEASKAMLMLSFQDCSEEDRLLPGWFMIDFTEYSK